MYATRAVNNIFPYMEINDVNVYYALTMYGIAGMWHVSSMCYYMYSDLIRYYGMYMYCNQSMYSNDIVT